MVDIAALMAERAELSKRHAAASTEFQNAKFGKRRKYKKLMHELEQQIRRLDKTINDANLSNQGIDSKAARIDSIGSSVSDSIGSIGSVVSSVYGGKFGKFGEGAANIAKEARIAQTGKTTANDFFSENKNVILIAVAAIVGLMLFMRKK